MLGEVVDEDETGRWASGVDWNGGGARWVKSCHKMLPTGLQVFGGGEIPANPSKSQSAGSAPHLTISRPLSVWEWTPNEDHGLLAFLLTSPGFRTGLALAVRSSTRDSKLGSTFDETRWLHASVFRGREDQRIQKGLRGVFDQRLRPSSLCCFGQVMGFGDLRANHLPAVRR